MKLQRIDESNSFLSKHFDWKIFKQTDLKNYNLVRVLMDFIFMILK